MAAVSIPALLAAFAGLCFALQAIAVERGAEDAKRAVSGSVSLLAALVSVVVSMSLFWLIVIVRGGPTHEVTPTAILVFAGIGVAYPAVYRLLYFRGIEEVGPSIAAAAITANPVVAAFLAVVLLGESLTGPILAGTLFIVGGAALLQHEYRTIGSETAANGGHTAKSEMDVLARRLATSDATDLLALFVAMLILGSAYVAISHGLSIFPDSVTATAITQTAGTVALSAYLLATSPDTLTRNLSVDRLTSRYMLLFVVAGVMVAFAWLGQFFALERGTVTTVVPIIYTFPLVLVAYAYATAREWPKSYKIVLGILTIVVGATLVEIF